MKYDSISGLFTAIADEIRAKDGSSELINPQDLPDRIKGLEVGGASGSKMRYLKRTGWLPAAGGGDISIYSAMSQVVRYEDSRYSDDGSVQAMIETGSQTLVGNNIYPIAFGFDPNTIVFDPRFNTEKTTLWEKLANIVYEPVPPEYADEYSDYIYPEYFEEITEEQFYDLDTLLSE